MKKTGKTKRGAKPVFKLSDGRVANAVARRSGVLEQTFYSRLRRGWTPEQAAGLEARPRGPGRFFHIMLADGRPGMPVAIANGVERRTFYHRVERGWTPEQAAGLSAPPSE